MSYDSVIVRNGDNLKFKPLYPNTILTGDDPLNIPTEYGQYYLNVTRNSRSFEKCANKKPIVLNQIFNGGGSPSYPSYVVSSCTALTFSNIPNNKYLMLVDSQIINWRRNPYGIPKLGLRVGNDFITVTYLNDFATTLTPHAIVDIVDNKLEIGIKATDCDNYVFDKFKVTLIPLN